MSRAAGFYWVRISSGWIVSRWVGSISPAWFLAGIEDPLDDGSILEVDERRIERMP